MTFFCFTQSAQRGSQRTQRVNFNTRCVPCVKTPQPVRDLFFVSRKVRKGVRKGRKEQIPILPAFPA